MVLVYTWSISIYVGFWHFDYLIVHVFHSTVFHLVTLMFHGSGIYQENISTSSWDPTL
jgi:hypothetical protein